MKVAINGFGRIGRLILRAFFESKKYDFEIVAINDLQNIDVAIHLLKHDSVHGAFGFNVEKISDNEFSVNGKSIKYTSEKNQTSLPWKEFCVDLVMECTGVFSTKEKCQTHITCGAKKVLLSCPSSFADKTIIFCVNNDLVDVKNDVFISNASCTTNCLAPIVHVLHREIKILNGFVTTVHSYTGDQRIVDMAHSDPRRARAAALSMIPTSTGATKAIEKIFPELSGKLAGLSVRVPTPNVSMLDFTFTASRDTNIDELNQCIEKYCNGDLAGILGYTYEKLVSTDFNHSPLSSIVDMSLTNVIDKRLCHIVSWYDNEWGFSNRMLDTAGLLF